MTLATQAAAREFPFEDREFPFEDKDFRFLSSLVLERTGIVLKDHKKNMMYSRLARRLRALGMTDFSQYCKHLKDDESGDELPVLVNAITTNLTKFFRESHHFDHLRDTVIPALVEEARRTGDKRLRIWSAGCSSGEEPYSIAMVLRDALPGIEGWDAKILATDLDTNMLDTGRRGHYGADGLSLIPAGYRQQIAKRGGDEIAMPDQAREMIAFKHLNLLHRWPMKGPFDAIFCRNVMIYFDNETKEALVNRYARMLGPKRWLFIGHSETLLDGNSEFALEGRTIYRRRH